jgi:signal transduction histidine kinase
LKFNTIRARIILYNFIGIALCATVSAFIVIKVVNDHMVENYDLNNSVATEALSYSLAPILETYDYKQVENIISSLIIYKNIATISVFDNDGTLIRSAREKEVTSQHLDIKKHNITVNDSVIGNFEIGFSRQYIDEQIQTTTWALIFGLIGFLALLGLALFIFINRSIIQPLEAFTKTVDIISAENLSVRVDMERSDELGTLTMSFNRMATNLEKSHTELQKANEELKQWSEELERKVTERTIELKQLNGELADINIQLEEASRHKSQFLANMSHELRTPLNSIIGYTKLILDGIEGEINAEQRQDLQTVYTNSKHLLDLINDLLDLSRIEAGKTVLTYGTFSIPDLLSEVIPVMNQMARQKGLDLSYAVTPNISHMYADRAKTKQVLINLLGNAIKFTANGSVKLNVSEDGSVDTFSVTDSGIGIKKEDLEGIFDSFQQGASTQAAGYEGTGLGLAISKHFIEIQGGRIWAESEPGKGSTFTFILPKKRIAGA